MAQQQLAAARKVREDQERLIKQRRTRPEPQKSRSRRPTSKAPSATLANRRGLGAKVAPLALGSHPAPTAEPAEPRSAPPTAIVFQSTGAEAVRTPQISRLHQLITPAATASLLPLGPVPVSVSGPVSGPGTASGSGVTVPLPPTLPTFPPRLPKPIHPGRPPVATGNPAPPMHRQASHPGIPSRDAFLQPFHLLYDCLDSSVALRHALEENVKRSAEHLAIMKRSSQTVERMVDAKIQAAVESHTRELQMLERRLDALEQRSGVAAGGGVGGIGARLERLERRVF